MYKMVHPRLTMEFEVLTPFNDEKPEQDGVWADTVPIVLKDSIYHCYINDEIIEPSNYAKLCLLLRTVEADKQVYLYLNTPGGNLDSVFGIIDSMVVCKADITAILSGTVASGGTMITMYADHIEVSPFVSFMIHYYSSGSYGKGNEIRDQVKFIERHLPAAYHTIYKQFLTSEEIKEIIDGRDMWMGMSEILDRWAKRVKND